MATFLHALLINEGKARFLTEEEVQNWTPSQGFLWLHFDLNAPETHQWIEQKSGMDDWEFEPFLETEGKRPRCMTQKNGTFLVLRALNANAEREMIFFHLWCEKHRLFTGSESSVFVLEDLKRRLMLGIGPSSIGEILDDICSGILDQTVAWLLDTEESVEALEEEDDFISDMSEIRRKLLGARHYLAPERDVFELLPRQNVSWLTPDDRYNLKENLHRMVRVIEDIDSLKERVIIGIDELNAKYREESQKNMDMISIIAALFIPLSFITGLLGINVGGIPFAQSSYGFWIVCFLLFVFCVIMLFIFRKMKWI